MEVSVTGPQDHEPIIFTFCLNRARLREAFRREGCYLLRSNLGPQPPARLWEFYLQLVEARLSRWRFQKPDSNEWHPPSVFTSGAEFFIVGRVGALMKIRPFQPEDEEAVTSLWQCCDLVRPWNDPRKDIRRKLRVRPDLFLVGVLDGQIVASVMAGYEGHRGWINYLAVAPEYQRRGFARAIVAEAERLLRECGCPKINLLVRASNHGVIEFYRRLGYSVDDVVSMGKRLEHDDRAA